MTAMRIPLFHYEADDAYIDIRADGAQVVVSISASILAGDDHDRIRRLTGGEALAMVRALLDAAHDATGVDDVELAEEIVIRHVDKTLTIDGERFRHYIGEDWRVEGGCLPRLTITIPAVRVLVQ